ncbi:MAG: hypothetical protein M0Z49_15205 [Chloroflexi bacterium]|nr:hypothetical protein [Chloroflexota bacterium]
MTEPEESRSAGTPSEAMEFVRFCYARRPVSWPQLYDEMSAVAARGLYRGWGYAELAEHGIRFTLPDLPGLAALASIVARAECARAAERRAAQGRGTTRRPAIAPVPTG